VLDSTRKKKKKTCKKSTLAFKGRRELRKAPIVFLGDEMSFVMF
jgi:hypothetical protein